MRGCHIVGYKRMRNICIWLLLTLLLLTGCTSDITSDPVNPTVAQRETSEATTESTTTSTEPSQDPLPPPDESIVPPEQPSGQLEVHFIDVGQGDAIYIKTPEQNIIIDGGDRGDTVVNYLKKQGVKHLDLVIGTYPHADHIGGLINVFRSIPVNRGY